MYVLKNHICVEIVPCEKFSFNSNLIKTLTKTLTLLSTTSLLYPHHKMWGGGLYWIRFVASVGPSVRLQFLSAL